MASTSTSATQGTSRMVNSVMSWVVCAPNEILVKSGVGIKDMEWSKKTFKGPFQKVTIFDMNPRNYTFTLNNMSSEMVPFSLPVVFTIGPHDPAVDPERFLVYARRMAGLTAQEMSSIIAGVVHGETRVYSATLTIKAMFEDRDAFKMQVQERIQKDMTQYGLHIYNANIAEMHDLDNHNKYFENLKQKALEGASTEARIQVAEARKRGEIGEQERKGETSIEVSKIKAQVMHQENQRQQEMEQSKLQLDLIKTKCQREDHLARVEADYATKQKQVELETAYHLLTAKEQTEKMRSVQGSAALVTAEANLIAAEGAANAAAKRAEGEALVAVRQAQAQAEAQRCRADADLYVETKRADGLLYAEGKKAEALALMRTVQAEGLRQVLEAMGGRPELALHYVSMESGLFDRMAQHTATAVRGLNPNINVWSNGVDGMAPVSKMLAGLPPMLDVIAQQTKVQLPSWMPQSSKAGADGGSAAASTAK